ncbi:magnesium transporter [Variovorax boronicumulans]|uniref:Magnesium transporter n=1 Tax=Variovorax boronicumulans TaxID=436515 RepID=A0AAW8E0G0_9BURK|nr:magnesium and cobalt transport protein CorA [Variovorax boronicumulans]MDP9880191.1 magnesium transporter [Variovorax boronicumulans]MDP9919781.1 magnesium transporter [Variovorax boronicumulans]MDP9925085.1 magnesium transporter [Variovorax boronicumulans]
MLINCVAYENGAKLADIPVEDISDYISRAGCFVWVALSDATPEELAQMQDEFDLHPLAVEDAQHGHQRPKVEEYGDSLFVVMHLVEPSTDAEGEGGHSVNVGEVNVFVGRNYVLSVRNRSQQGFLGVRERCEREPDLLRNGAGFVLYALMDAVVDRYFPVIDALEVELESIEQQIFAQGGAARDKIKQLYDLKRRSLILKRAVAPLVEAAGKLHGGRVPQICVGTQEYFRDVGDHLVRINGSIDAVRDTIATAVQVNLSMVTIEESEVTKRLAAWASIFAVCTAFAGIWGMNFEHMPELKFRYGYAMALGLIVSTCGYLYYRFKRVGWL